MDEIAGAADETYYNQMASLNEEYYVNSYTFNKSNIEYGTFFILQEEIKLAGADSEEQS